MGVAAHWLWNALNVQMKSEMFLEARFLTP